MTIPFGELKARLLANPEVKAEYHALAPGFEISTKVSPRLHTRRSADGSRVKRTKTVAEFLGDSDIGKNQEMRESGSRRYSAATSSSVGHFFISTRCSYFSKFALS